MANFIPPANGVSKGNYFLPKSHKLTVFEEKTGYQKQLWQPNVQTFFSPFCSASPEIIGVKVDHRQTNSLTPYTGVCGFFISVKFATSLLASLAGG